ncbi:MAG: glycosyltransferase family 9 protein [Zetaproteobacteria bacterium]|nr:glycosyltransferase family 9 protein [Zetaproteobacteria bacterium]
MSGHDWLAGKQAPRILLIQLRQLGDILLTTPCIREMKDALPGAQLTFCAHRMAEPILGLNPYLDQCLFYDDKMSLTDKWRLLRTIRQQKFDLVLDFMANPRSALFTLAARAGKTLSFHTSRHFVYHACVPRHSAGRYIVDAKFDLLRYIGLQPQNHQTELPFARQDLQVWQAYAQQHFSTLKSAPLKIYIAPTHRRAARRWPLARYAALADWLVEQWSAHVLWGWGPGEKEVALSVQRLCQRPTYLVPPTSLRQLTAFMSRMDLFIGNSNGPSHIAVAVGTSSVQIHGPTQLESWSPLNAVHGGVGAADGDVASVTVEQVKERVRRRLPDPGLAPESALR